MNIFGVGGAELVLIILIMLVVAGPKRMIRWMYILGQWVGRFRDMWSQVVDVMEKEMRDAGMDVNLPRDIPSKSNLNQWANQLVKPYANELEQEFKDVSQPVKDIIKETNAVMKEADSKIKQSTVGMGAWAAQNGTIKPANQSTPKPETPQNDLTLDATSNNSTSATPSTDDTGFGAWGNPQHPSQQTQETNGKA